MELVRSDGVSTRDELIYSEEVLRATVAATSVLFDRVLAVAASKVVDSELVFVSVLGLVFVKFDVFFKYYFLALNMAWPDSRDPISLMSCIGEIVNLHVFFYGIKSHDVLSFIIIVGEGHMFGKDRHILLVEFVPTNF